MRLTTRTVATASADDAEHGQGRVGDEPGSVRDLSPDQPTHDHAQRDADHEADQRGDGGLHGHGRDHLAAAEAQRLEHCEVARARRTAVTSA